MSAGAGGDSKTLVRRLIEEVMNAGRLEVLNEVYAPEAVGAAHGWVQPFRAAFPDVPMEIVVRKPPATRTFGSREVGSWSVPSSTQASSMRSTSASNPHCSTQVRPCCHGV